MTTDISVIIPTYNSARTLSKCLDSIKRQSVNATEIIVVDRFSGDGTPTIGRTNGARVVQADANRSVARNIGLEHSSSSAVLYVDSDMTLTSNVLEDCIAGLADHDALIIPEVSIGAGFWAHCKAIERQSNRGDTLIEAPRCFRRSALLSLGGYDPNLEAGEDWDLHSRGKREGLAIGRVESTIIHDSGDHALVTTLRKKYHYGKLMELYFKSHTRASIRQVSPVRRILIPGLKVMPSNPAYGLGLMFLKTAEFTVAAFGSLNTVVKHLKSSSSASNLK
jgi:arabinofuranan 3-O-arabinosyltransferase